MYRIDEIIDKLQTTLAAAKEATCIGKEAELPTEAITSLEETESKIKATLDEMITLGHQRGAEEPFKVRRKPLDPHLSQKREQNS